MKNNFKHIIALLLVIMMSFQMAAFVAADETASEEVIEEEVYVPQNMREFEILDALGVFSIYEKEDFTGYAELTRAEAAAVAARMVGLIDANLAEGTAMPYTDVKVGDTYDYEIYHITNLGIMGGYNGQFNPDGAITEEQFVKVVVEALGYGPEAQSMGGYPHGYTITAGKYHILDGVNFAGAVALTQDVAVKIVYNCLNIEMPKVTSVENGGYLTEVGGTIMSKYLNVYRAYGILNRNSSTYISVGDAAKKGVVQIGKEYYYTGISGCDEYLGYNVEFFYKKTADEKMGTIIWAAPWHNDVIRVEADDIVGYSNKQYTYYNGNKELKEKITGADVIYNGSSVKTGGFDKFVPEIGYVDLIDNDQDGTVDVVSIISYDVYFIKANNTTDYKLSADDGKLIKDYDKIYWTVTDLNGEELPAAKIAKDMVLLLAVSLDQKVVSGFQINEQIEGTYEGKYVEGGVNHAIINGYDYRVHSYCASDYSKIKMGDYVGFYTYGDLLLIKCLPASSLTESVGYLIEMGGTSGLSSTVMARMLLQTGEVKIVTINEKAKLILGNNTYKEPTEFAKLLTHSLDVYAGSEDNSAAAGVPETTVSQPIVYKLNAAGEVIMLQASTTHNYNERVDILSDVDGFNLVHIIRAKWHRMSPRLRSAGDTGFLFDKNAYVIDIPSDPDNYNGYKIYKYVDMSNWDTGADGNYTRPYRLYRTGNDILGANIMVGTQVRNSSVSGGTTLIVDKIAEGVTDDGVECYILSGKSTSLADVTVKTADKSVVDSLTTNTVTIGDLIMCSKDSFGLVDKITVGYDRETAKVLANSGEYFGSGSYNVGGQVYMIKGDSLAYYPGVISGTVASTDCRYMDIASFKYVIFDSTLDRASTHLVGASLGEVKAYVEDPANVTTFLATMSGTTQGIFVIYK